MATHAVASGAKGTAEFTLAAATVDTVNFADDLSSYRIVSDGAAAVWYTDDGTEPTVGGANCDYIPAGGVGVDDRLSRKPGPTTIKLISSGTPTLRVSRFPESV